MPNLCVNRLTCKGISEMDIFTEKKGRKELDFNKVVPMPELLRKTISPVKCEAVLAYFMHICKDVPAVSLCDTVNELVRSIRFCNGVNKEKIAAMSDKELQELLTKTYAIPEDGEINEISAVELGGNYVECFQTTGSFDWYEWSCKNWGCKWNASETETEGDTVSFYTPWDKPTAFLTALSEKYPDAEFALTTSFEGELIDEYSCKLKNGEIYDEEVVTVELEDGSDETE